MPGSAPPAPDIAAARAFWSDELWGEGFLLPGGVAEATRLANLLPLSPATTVLLLGADAGGMASLLVKGRGAWVAAQQDNPALLERTHALLPGLGKRASLAAWNPAAPAFRAGYHHHALAVEALHRASPGLLLPAIAAALRQGGQLVLLEVVLLAPPGADSAYLARWQELDGRALPPPTEAAMAEALAVAGFHLHVTEDCGPRHAAAALGAWGRVIQRLQGQGRPGQLLARGLLAEAELWLLRQRLFTTGCLGLRRWHASLIR